MSLSFSHYVFCHGAVKNIELSSCCSMWTILQNSKSSVMHTNQFTLLSASWCACDAKCMHFLSVSCELFFKIIQNVQCRWHSCVAHLIITDTISSAGGNKNSSAIMSCFVSLQHLFQHICLKAVFVWNSLLLHSPPIKEQDRKEACWHLRNPALWSWGTCLTVWESLV